MSSSAVDIRLVAHYDPKPMQRATQDVEKYTESLRKNSLFRSDRMQSQGLLNLSRQGADIFTQGVSGVSPFTILIQQGPQVLDILASGALSAGKFAAALGVMGAAAGGAILAIKYIQDYKADIDAAADAQERLNKATFTLGKHILENGIAAEKVARARKVLIERDAILRFQPGSSQERTEIAYAREQLISNEAVNRYERGQFEKLISPRVLQAAQEQDDLERYGAMTIDELKTQRGLEVAVERQGLVSGTGEGAVRANQAREMIDKLDTFIDAMEKAAQGAKQTEREISERKAREQQEWDEILASIRREFESQIEVPERKSEMMQAFRPGAVSARQALGGMANAPILSSWQKQVQLLEGIKRASEQTAANTATSTPPASPVSNPDPFLNIPRTYTRIAGN